MSEQQRGWKAVLKELSAIGWIGFFLLVIAIGFGTLCFGDSNSRNTSHTPRANHAAR